jgi:hypothetical protein
MTKFRVTPIVRGYDFCPVEFDTLDEVKSYVTENPPGYDTALDLVDEDDPDFFVMRYVVEDCDDEGRTKELGTVEDGETWFEEDLDDELAQDCCGFIRAERERLKNPAK